VVSQWKSFVLRRSFLENKRPAAYHALTPGCGFSSINRVFALTFTGAVFLPVQAELDEHQIRDPEDLRKQMEYVAGNPARTTNF
jgi:hypothetical protein